MFHGDKHLKMKWKWFGCSISLPDWGFFIIWALFWGHGC